MILAQNNPRRQSSLHQALQSHHQRQQQQQQQQFPHAQHISIPSTPQQPHAQPWVPVSLPLTPQPQSTFTTHGISHNINFNFGSDQILFDFQPQQFTSSQVQSQSLMQSEQSNNSWMSNGQLTPTSTTTRPRHHRESSLSSLGSPAAPASPFAPTTSNPQVAGESYHDFHDFAPTSSKPLTPAHTPLQDQFLSPHYPNFYPNASSLAYTMSHDGLPKQLSNSNELMASAEFSGQGPTRPSLTTVASSDSQFTPPSCEDERQKSAHRSTMPKLDRTMTDIYADELYNPNFSITSAPPSTPASAVQTSANMSPRNDVFTQRLQAANSQHLSANNQIASTLSPRERSPFRQGSPLAPSSASFSTQSPSMRFGTATHLREQQKAENDARALQQQFERTSPESNTPKTISPKDVDLVYHESDEDANMPLFPPPQQQQQRRSPAVYRQQPVIAQEPSESEETSASQQSFRSMATTRRESSSAYSTSSSHTTPQQAQYNFATSAVPGNIQRPVPQLQQYPFVSQAQRQSSNLSSVGDDFPAALTSMDSTSSSEYTPDTKSPQQLEIRKPQQTTADTGTYTCTYHGCTLRFETPQKLQKHKREGHRNSASLIGSTGINGGENRGMTSAAQKLNSQSGPHKCERINPSTGKPCNTIFSRPYDLTRHEDTIHNTRKQKLRCELCTEEKTFSRNDALTRHMRVVHPEVPIHIGKGRRRGTGVSMG
ncbi:hypothetical protein ACMFMF_011282 [Clarireedia jacksonii]